MDILKNIARSILKEEISSMRNTIIDLMEKKDNESSLEGELNGKYPKVNLTYSRIETDGSYKVALQDFFAINDFSIPIQAGNTDDEKALNCLKYVIDNIKYTPDKIEYGYGEYWAYPYQTLKRKGGDCEDGAILLANMMIRSGIPYWKVRITAGDVDDGQGNSGGHCFVVYYYETGGYWVLLDWCYWQNTTEIKDRKNYKDENFYKVIWFSFNEKYSFSNQGFTNINTKFKGKKAKRREK